MITFKMPVRSSSYVTVMNYTYNLCRFLDERIALRLKFHRCLHKNVIIPWKPAMKRTFENVQWFELYSSLSSTCQTSTEKERERKRVNEYNMKLANIFFIFFYGNISFFPKLLHARKYSDISNVEGVIDWVSKIPNGTKGNDVLRRKPIKRFGDASEIVSRRQPQMAAGICGFRFARASINLTRLRPVRISCSPDQLRISSEKIIALRVRDGSFELAEMKLANE